VNGKVIRGYSSSAPRKKGIGIAGKRGEIIRAAGAGKVVYSGDGLLGYGNLIIVKHNETYLSAYAHSLSVLVKEGQVIKRGQKVATMGLNENGTPMLHFEIRRNGKPVNPISYLPRR
jgi:lipoprotein NlpD